MTVNSVKFRQAQDRIITILAESDYNADRFAQTLWQQGIPHLSFSQITTVEFCERRYYLSYILHLEPDPIPGYFVKGKLMHELIAQSYDALRSNHAIAEKNLEGWLCSQVNEMDARHIINAYHLHRQNLWRDHQIEGIEHPFVFCVDEQLPPMVGVIDLILTASDGFFLVDHKTGANFYPDDELQVAIYARYMQTRHAGGNGNVRLFYDHYRWVNNFARIRKPAFQRREAQADLQNWHIYLQRIQNAYRLIEKIQQGKTPERSRSCYRCPYRHNC